ncbi:LolA-related protein [Kozakia baliensis]|uniref:LolA-related protein n=1 Tax=Kozakia baliensis TaxID=153496 RepID=UPI00087C7A18|nr:LolA-related protein [Kozakia baliensis]AOX19095.1 hypothetical protein A0U90_00970 [Kozakia baliensis]
MKKFRFLLLVLAFPCAVQAADLPDEIIFHLGQVAERHQHFHETRTLKALTAPIQSQGELIYRHPGYLAKITHTPRPEQLIVSGDQVSMTRGNRPAHQVPIDANPALRLMIDTLRAPLDGDVPALKRHYTLSATGDLSHWNLVLTPADAQSAKIVHGVTLEGQNNAISTVTVTQANGDFSKTIIDP